MFIPLIIVRMSGFKPSSQHSMVMMTAALVAVITWRILGLNVHIFESVPGMGAAFIAHFIMVLKDKDPWLDKLPERNKIATLGIGLLVLIIPVEYYYANNAPTSMSSSTPDPDSMWNLTVEFEYSYSEETTFIGNGDTNSFYFDIPADAIQVIFCLLYTSPSPRD